VERGEFWVDNPFMMPAQQHNLSAFEQNHLFLNYNGKRFINVSHASQANIDSDSRSAIVADFNGDHDPDLLVGSVGGGPLRLFENQFPKTGHRVRLNLVGHLSNPRAIGARVVLQCGNRRIVRDVFPADGFMGQSPPELLIGVGKAERIDRLSVRWPTGRTEHFENIPSDHVITVEGSTGSFHAEAFKTSPEK